MVAGSDCAVASWSYGVRFEEFSQKEAMYMFFRGFQSGDWRKRFRKKHGDISFLQGQADSPIGLAALNGTWGLIKRSFAWGDQ